MIVCFAIMLAYYLIFVVFSLSVTGIILVVAASLAYVFVFGIYFQKPQYSLYAFLVLQLLCPRGRWYENYAIISDKTFGVYPFLIVELLSGIPILMHLLSKPAYRRIPKHLQLFVVGSFWCCLTLIVFESIRQLYGSIGFVEYTVDTRAISNGASFLCCLVFLYGCTQLLENRQHIERLMLIILICGFELALEALFYQVLRLPLARSENVAHFGPEGRFLGLVFGSYAMLVNVSFAAIGVCLYYLYAKRRFQLWFLLPALYLPIFVTYQRSPLLAGLLIPPAFVLIWRKSSKYLIILLSLSVLVFMSYGTISDFFISHNILGIAESRAYFFESDNYVGSYLSRIGLQLRGIELFFASFPFGIGVDDDRFYEAMGSSSVPALFQQFVSSGSGSLKHTYSGLTSNIYASDTHNWFLKFIIEYGVIGLITLGSLMVVCIVGIRNFFGLVNVPTNDDSLRDLRLLRVTSFSIVIGMMVYFLFQGFALYSLLFFCLFLMNVELTGLDKGRYR